MMMKSFFVVIMSILTTFSLSLFNLNWQNYINVNIINDFLFKKQYSKHYNSKYQQQMARIIGYRLKEFNLNVLQNLTLNCTQLGMDIQKYIKNEKP